MATPGFVSGSEDARSARNILLKRLARVVDGMSSREIEHALGEDDVGTLVDVVSQDLWRDETLNGIDRARLRGVQYRFDLIKQAGGALSVAETATALGITSQAVRKRITAGQLIAMKHQGGYKIPAIQIADGRLLPGLPDVLGALSIDSPWMRLDWLMSDEPRLENRTPLAALRAGAPAETIQAAARMVGEQGAA